MNKQISSYVVFLLLVIFLPSCATPVAKITNTDSGKPEVIIETNNIDSIKSLIISEMVNFGYQIEKDTPYLLEMARATDSRENMTAALSIGNSSSTNNRLATYTFVKLNNGIRVIAAASLRAQLPGGKVNFSQLSNNGSIYNIYQKQLFVIKEKIERKTEE